MQLSKLLPPFLVVGIGYRMGGLAETVEVRARDLTPSRDERFATIYGDGFGLGGASRFLAAIREELMPWIAARYSIQPGDATYFGHSLGGLFGAYALIQEPSTFGRFVLGSPSCWWDHGIIFRLVDDYVAQHDDLAASVFIGVGALETPEGRRREVANHSAEEQALAEQYPNDMVELAQRLAAALRAPAFPSLDVEAHVYDDEFHITVWPLIVSRGLRHLFDAP
jgi:predicted alpha/beta superfamily hydrolase